MHHTADMLRAHPKPPSALMKEIQACIEACFDCAQTCQTCADACLSEPNVAEMVQCIRLNLDCADVCEVTGRLASRLATTGAEPFRAQLQACIEACRACGDECANHAGHMEHCRICAEACRACEQACRQLLEASR